MSTARLQGGPLHIGRRSGMPCEQSSNAGASDTVESPPLIPTSGHSTPPVVRQCCELNSFVFAKLPVKPPLIESVQTSKHIWKDVIGSGCMSVVSSLPSYQTAVNKRSCCTDVLNHFAVLTPPKALLQFPHYTFFFLPLFIMEFTS